MAQLFRHTSSAAHFEGFRNQLILNMAGRLSGSLQLAIAACMTRFHASLRALILVLELIEVSGRVRMIHSRRRGTMLCSVISPGNGVDAFATPTVFG